MTPGSAVQSPSSRPRDGRPSWRRAARTSTSAGDTAHGVVLGTPGYMAPEQARGETRRLDARAGVYSLGAIVGFFLTGRSPLEATAAGIDSPGTRAPVSASTASGSVRPRAREAIRAKAMAYDSVDRDATAAELAAEVARYLDGLPIEAYPESRLVRAGRVISRNRALIILVLAYLVVRVFLIFWARR